jgi:hypothetical protein
MKKLNRTGRTFATVVAGATVIALFGTGTAVAGGLITSAKIKNNTVKSIDVKDGNLKGVDVADGSLGGADLADGSLSGADLADGSIGGADVADGSVNGADIADGSLSNQDVGVLFATVNADGTLDRSSGDVSVIKTGAGSYRVDFNRQVRDCAFTATVGIMGDANHYEGDADVTSQLFDNTAVHVYTRTAATTTEADLPFMVTAVC